MPQPAIWYQRRSKLPYATATDLTPYCPYYTVRVYTCKSLECSAVHWRSLLRAAGVRNSKGVHSTDLAGNVDSPARAKLRVEFTDSGTSVAEDRLAPVEPEFLADVRASCVSQTMRRPAVFLLPRSPLFPLEALGGGKCSGAGPRDGATIRRHVIPVVDLVDRPLAAGW